MSGAHHRNCLSHSEPDRLIDQRGRSWSLDATGGIEAESVSNPIMMHNPMAYLVDLLFDGTRRQKAINVNGAFLPVTVDSSLGLQVYDQEEHKREAI